MILIVFTILLADDSRSTIRGKTVFFLALEGLDLRYDSLERIPYYFLLLCSYID